MDSYKIEWKRSASKELKQLPKEIIGRIMREVEQLASNPFPPGIRKLKGSKHTYRIRIGSYRVVYNVLAGRLVVEIIRVGHRKIVYK